MKFRAWDKQQGKMLYDGFAIVPSSPTWSATILRYDEKVDTLINDYWKEKGDILGGDYSTIDHTDWYGIEYLEVMRSTGLLDMNGDEIWEGDIVNADGKRRTIKWANGKFWFVADFSGQHEDISEIFNKYYGKVEKLSNIYETTN